MLCDKLEGFIAIGQLNFELVLEGPEEVQERLLLNKKCAYIASLLYCTRLASIFLRNQGGQHGFRGFVQLIDVVKFCHNEALTTFKFLKSLCQNAEVDFGSWLAVLCHQCSSQQFWVVLDEGANHEFHEADFGVLASSFSAA